MSTDSSGRQLQHLISQMVYQQEILGSLDPQNDLLKSASGFYQQLEVWAEHYSEEEVKEALLQFNTQNISLLSRGPLLWLGEQILAHHDTVSETFNTPHLQWIIRQLSGNMRTMDEFSTVVGLSAFTGHAPAFPAWAFLDPRTNAIVSNLIQTGLTQHYTPSEPKKIVPILQSIPLSSFPHIAWTADNSGAPSVVEHHADMYELSCLFVQDLNWDRQKHLLDRWGVEVVNNWFVTEALQSRLHGDSTIFSSCPAFDKWVQYAHSHWPKEEVVKLFEPIAYNLGDQLLMGSSQLQMWKTIADLPHGHKAFQIIFHSLLVALPYLAQKKFTLAASVAHVLTEALADPKLGMYLPKVVLEELDITQYFSLAERGLRPQFADELFNNPLLLQRFASSRFKVLNEALKQLHPSVWGTAQALLFTIGGPPMEAGAQMACNGGSIRRQYTGMPKSTSTHLFHDFTNSQLRWDSMVAKAALVQSLDGVNGNTVRTKSKL